MSSQQEEAPDAGAKGRSIWTRLTLAVFLLPSVVVLFPTTIVLAPMMLPTLVAFLIDRLPGRPFTITVGLLNVAGSLPAVLQLWSDGHNLVVTQDVLSNLFFWLVAYLCAAIGWCIYIVLPAILRQYYGSITDNRVRALQDSQQKLIDEWGESVTGTVRTQAKDPEQDPNAQIDRAAKDLSN